ncbi:MAG: ribose ABC transporter [Oceanospirillaceae bacterium]|nr:ribose ABC transporter [Oceanospirillaceae bacterium]
MLKNIDPLLSADLLYHLRAMGHGDELVIVDGNYPAASNAKNLVALPGNSATRVLEAITSVLVLDDFVKSPAHRMQVVDDPQQVPAICKEFQQIVNSAEQRDVLIETLPRFEFYARAKQAYLIVSTTEARLYGNIILTKGVIRAAENQRES